MKKFIYNNFNKKNFYLSIFSIFLLIATPCFIITETTNAQNNETNNNDTLVTYTLTIFQTPNGLVSSTRKQAKYGECIIVTGEPNNGYYLDHWNETIFLSDTVETFTHQGNPIALFIYGNTFLSAKFIEKDSFNISVDDNLDHLIIFVDKTKVAKDDTITIDVLLEEGYGLKDLEVTTDRGNGMTTNEHFYTIPVRYVVTGNISIGATAELVYNNVTNISTKKENNNKTAQKYLDKSGNLIILYQKKFYNILGSEIK